VKKASYRPYLFFGCALLLLLALPVQVTERLRYASVFLALPVWKALRGSSPDSLEKERLAWENQALRAQVDSVREWLLFDQRVDEQLDRLKELTHREEGDAFWREFFRRRGEELAQRLSDALQSLPATVVFREPASWSSALWIDVGERDNESLGRVVVAKNSPVIAGRSVVGVVEEVGSKQSRVRLITDPRLVPAVRAVRGGEQHHRLLEHINALLVGLEQVEGVSESMRVLRDLKALLSGKEEARYLAKGELHGSGAPLWRARHPLLRGVGFNYDFADAEGPGRDLRTGEAIQGGKRSDPVALLQPGDLLVTTGLDGVFPPGLDVAVVTQIELLREGGCTYELQAAATAENLQELSHVRVLPPRSPE
jgi:cell shape-determining protein MreC